MVLKGIQPISFSSKKRGTKKFCRSFSKFIRKSGHKNGSQRQSNGPENSKVLGKEVPIRDADPAITCHDLI